MADRYLDWLNDLGQYDLPVDEHPLREEVRRKANHYLTGRNHGRDINLRHFTAIELLRHMDASLRDQEDVQIRLGQLLAGARRLSEAVDAYAAALASGGTVPAVYHGYVHTALLSGRQAEALPLVARGIDLCPTDQTLKGLRSLLNRNAVH